nr:hypothetical protein [uncultured Allomuricauda sp.]
MLLKIKLPLTILYFFLCTSLFAQEKILEFNTEYEDFPSSIENSFTLVDEFTGNFTVFLTKNNDIAAYHFDASYKNIGRLVSKELSGKYKLPLGGTINKKEYSIFYSNEDKNKFAGITFDFKKIRPSVFEIDLKLKKEIYLTQFVYENTFRIITSSYRENYIYVYTFDNNGAFTKKTIDLSGYNFYGNSEYPSRLKSALGLNLHHIKHLTEVVYAQDKVPYSLDSMISWIKMYMYGDSLFIVSDLNRDFTQIITYNLKNEVATLDKIDHASTKLESKSNSYLLNDKLFQINVNPEEIILKITSLTSKEVLKEHRITKKDELSLANGPIRQRGGRYKKYREFEKTSQFLRKLSNGNLALHVGQTDKNYTINIGSVDEVEGLVDVLVYLNPVSIVGVVGPLTIYVNPLALALLKASKTKAVYINSILDENFELTLNKEKDNIFYVVEDFIEKEEIKRYKAADLFRYKGYYIFGLLDKKSKKYSLRKFSQ